MDDHESNLITTITRQLIRRTQAAKLGDVLSQWKRLTKEELLAIDFTFSKSAITEHLIGLFEEKGTTLKHVLELEMISVMDNPNRGMWYAFQMDGPTDEADTVDLSRFKTQFKVHLSQLLRHVSVTIKKADDDAVWIRVAWGDNFTRPNELKPTYIVHYLQTPYFFVISVTAKHKPLLDQAMALTTGYVSVEDAKLSGRNLTAISDLLLRRYEQEFPTRHPDSLQENDPPASNPNIIHEQAKNAESRRQAACKAFGKGKLPQLESVTYKLETKFRDGTNQVMTDSEEPFRCKVTFTSTNLLESLRHAAESGVLSNPDSNLMSAITRKGRNYFVVADKRRAGPSEN